jgi:NADPH:quinone reductase-like Zn-dependent oxidoreductase
VTNVKVGDEVYSRVPEDCRGTVAEYALTTSATVAKKPKSLSFTDSASIPLAGMTALQALEWADKRLEGGIKGKTVLIPGGLSGTGIFAVQLAKSVFGAAKVITTLSTAKIQKAKELWGEEGIQYVDYSKSDVVSAVGKGTVDYFFDSMGTGSEYSPLVKRGGVCVSISSLPSGDTMAKNAPELPWLVKQGLNAADWWLSRKFTAAGIQYTYIFMEPSGKELEQFSQWVDEGKITTLVGQTAKLDDIAAVRKGCQQIYDAKGGIGKFVIDVISIE